MSGTAAAFQLYGGNSFSIVSDAQSQFMLIVSDFHFDMVGNSVAKGISNHFTADAIDFVVECGGKLLWIALNDDVKTRHIFMRILSACQLLSDSSQRLAEVAFSRPLRVQVVDGIATLSEGLFCRDNRFIQRLHR